MEQDLQNESGAGKGKGKTGSGRLTLCTRCGGIKACSQSWYGMLWVTVAESMKRPWEGSGEVCMNQITVVLIGEFGSYLSGHEKLSSDLRKEL